MKFRTLFGAALLGSTMLVAGVAEAKSLVYCSEGSPENFTPAMNTTGTSLDAARPIYNQLVEFERGSTNVVAGLAESWEVSPDGMTITFKLRKGVKFHFDKGELTTKDVELVYKASLRLGEVQPTNSKYYNDLVEKIEVVNDYEVVYRLTGPDANFLRAMSEAAREFGRYRDVSSPTPATVLSTVPTGVKSRMLS